MREVSVRIPVCPTAKGRPKFSTFGGHIHAYTPKKTRLFEECISDHYKKATSNYKFEKDQAICVTIVFGMPIPMSTPKSRRAAMKEGIICHTKKPDLDNLIKSVLDALNEVAWEDDAQIVGLTAAKEYAADPFVYIRIYESVY